MGKISKIEIIMVLFIVLAFLVSLALVIMDNRSNWNSPNKDVILTTDSIEYGT